MLTAQDRGKRAAWAVAPFDRSHCEMDRPQGHGARALASESRVERMIASGMTNETIVRIIGVDRKTHDSATATNSTPAPKSPTQGRIPQT